METKDSPMNQGIQAPPPGTFSNPSRSKRLWLWISLPIALVVVIGGAYFAHSQGLITLPFLSPSGTALFEKMVDSMSGIKNAQYSFSMNLVAEPRESAKAQGIIASAQAAESDEIFETTLDDSLGETGAPLELGDAADASEILFQMLPPDVSIQGDVRMYFEQSKHFKDANGFITLSGSYAGGDTTYEVDFEIKKIGPAIYGIVNKMPSMLFFDLSPVKGKWIVINDPTNTAIYENEDFASSEEILDTGYLKKILEVAIQEKLITVSASQGTENIDGHRAREYEVRYSPERLPIVYQEMAKYARTEGKDPEIWDNAASIVSDPMYDEYLELFSSQQSMRVWIDEKSGYLRKIETVAVMTPPDSVEKMAGKQMRATMSMVMTHINEEVEIEAPTETIDLGEAEKAISGMHEEELSDDHRSFDQQVEQISTLRQSLEIYFQTHNTYPATLADLISETKAECVESSDSADCGNYSAIAELNTQDVFSNQSYSYSSTGEDYSLAYELEYYDGITRLDEEFYAEGSNTATRSTPSLEAQATLEEDLTTETDADEDLTDKDGDGLQKWEEEYYGSNPSLTDSDGDGFNDATEIDNGYNPNGPGLLEIPSSD